MGAFFAFYVVFEGHNLWVGVLAAIAIGVMMGLLKAFVSVTMQSLQGISGIGLYLFGLGLSSLLFKTLIGSVEGVSGFRQLAIPLLADIPGVGHILFNHNALVYLAYLMVPVSWFVINRTTLGLKIRAVGHNPEAADTLGCECEWRTLYDADDRRRPGCGGRGLAQHRSAERIPGEHDKRAWFYCGCPRLLWQLAHGGCTGRCTTFQFGQCIAAMGPGVKYSGPIRSSCHDAIHHDNRGACLHSTADSEAGGFGQVV